MADSIIPAEIKPKPDQATKAAAVLERLGFRVLHIGSTISVQGHQETWESTFNVSFVPQKKSVITGLEKSSEITYQKVMTENMRIPIELRELIDDVMFVEPPEFF